MKKSSAKTARRNPISLAGYESIAPAHKPIVVDHVFHYPAEEYGEEKAADPSRIHTETYAIGGKWYTSIDKNGHEYNEYGKPSTLKENLRDAVPDSGVAARVIGTKIMAEAKKRSAARKAMLTANPARKNPAPRRNPPKADAQRHVKLAESYLGIDLQRAKQELEAAYRLIAKAWPAEWARALLYSAQIKADTLNRMGVVIHLREPAMRASYDPTTPSRREKAAGGSGRMMSRKVAMNPRRRNPDLTGHYDVKPVEDVHNYDEAYLLTTLGRVKSYIRPYTGPMAGQPEARGIHEVRFDDDRIKPKTMSNYAIARAITAANIDRAVQAARRDAMSKHEVQHAMLTENPRRRKNPSAKAKPLSRAARAVKRVQEALAAGVVLPFSTMRSSGTAGPYHEAVGGKNNFAIFRDHKGAAKDDYYPSAFSAADHLVSFIGEGNAIEALKEAAKKVGLRYVNLDTPIPWTAGRRRF